MSTLTITPSTGYPLTPVVWPAVARVSLRKPSHAYVHTTQAQVLVIRNYSGQDPESLDVVRFAHQDDIGAIIA